MAMLLAVHPLHVESVAWVAERKDVLSMFFLLWGLYFYTRYVEAGTGAETRSDGESPLRPGSRSGIFYGAALLGSALSLMAKPMMVTLPVCLLLLDYWPLGRFNRGGPSRAIGLLLEKIPFFLLSAILLAVTMLTAGSGAKQSFENLPLTYRLGNAVLSYGQYLRNTLAPSQLGLFYPHPGADISWGWVLAAGGVLLALGGAAVYYRRPAPYLIVGLAWFLVVLSPVIGLVQAGSQALADRFIYIPAIGLYLALVWGAARLTRYAVRLKYAIPAAGVLILSIFLFAAEKQTGYWRDSLSIFKHTAEVTRNNYQMHNNIGSIYLRQGRIAEAMKHLARAWQIRPDWPMIQYNLGTVYMKTGDLKAATVHLRRAVHLDPFYEPAHINLGLCLFRRGLTTEALSQLRTALKLNAGNPRTHFVLGTLLLAMGREKEAVVHLNAALELNPNDAEVKRTLEKINDDRKRRTGQNDG